MEHDRSGQMPLQNEQQIVATRQTVRSLCQMLKFSLVDQTKMITAASELSRNTLIHGKGGHMNWAIIEVNGKQALQLIFEDTGPGIKDLKMAMTDGFTTGMGMGLGLPGSKRLVNDFKIETELGQGTRVSITKWK
ncbi:putative anti-sigma regulatory factor, serine/threonine protein kinase [Delftia acidovorans SPH-1]|uniref:Anti-sigma regulatory factor n=3 Tax=Pseudomonadati TaxID=3379134 RepID=A0AAJ2R1P7_DELAC|nr:MULTISPECIES: anti-sigma regulatory factor [Delftia]MBA4005624.1 anti-sigma regulatory factor [Delftia sp.]ABX37040.1 putative anti-sigma regulatory factor, serine/threonine protein kinase [Delftia acidovorans SPH-1]MBJ2140091.1 anti-sigma regulatory factor [Delftia acidovorans]MCB4786290.1 anti-sigma regulatory factor [Delftia sp. Lp-1]MCG3783047.1 anti-sigma regulatory factor [Delftia acidovorans]